MDVRAINDSRLQVQSPSVAAGAMDKTARNLQEKTSASADALNALDHVIGAMESGRSLEMHYDKDIGRIVVQVVNGQNKTVDLPDPSRGDREFDEELQELS